MEGFGEFILRMFSEFRPYEVHNRAVLAMAARLGSHEDRQLSPILFEGQGIARVFEAHRVALREKLKDGGFETDVPKIEEISKQLDDTASRIAQAVARFRKERASGYLEKVTDKAHLPREEGELHPRVVSFFNDLYDNVFTSVAFQAALSCTFFNVRERTDRELGKLGREPVDAREAFGDFLRQLNGFFVPATSARLKPLVRLFAGEPDGDLSEWKITRSSQTFRSVVHRGEMQPDQWPKYKYLLLEVWRPSNADVGLVVSRERDKCRLQVFKSLYEDYRDRYAQKAMKHEDALEAAERKEIYNEAYEAFAGFLRIVNWPVSELPSRGDLETALEGAAEDADTPQEEPEHWESVGE